MAAAPAPPAIVTHKVVRSLRSGRSEGSSEIGQHPHGQKVDAQKRRHAGNRAHPARWFEGELPGVHAGEPVADAELAKANLEGREERKPRRPSNGHEAACLEAL